MLSPELEADVDLTGRGTLVVSEEEASGSSGTFDADRARLMAAAEGVLVLEPARLGPLLGLTSVLLLRERKPVLEFVPGGAAERWFAGAGDASRDESGELADEEGPDTLRERAPASCGCRIDGFGVDAGSADSSMPVMDWKPSSAVVVVMMALLFG